MSMDIHEVRHVFTELIANELLKANQAFQELGEFAKSWSTQPQYPSIPGEVQIAKGASLYVLISDNNKPILVCDLDELRHSPGHIESARSIAEDLLLRVEYEPKEVERIFKAIADFKKWALWAKEEIENSIREMMEEQWEYVERLMAEWSVCSLSK